MQLIGIRDKFVTDVTKWRENHVKQRMAELLDVKH
jgi:hypothetical protein